MVAEIKLSERKRGTGGRRGHKGKAVKDGRKVRREEPISPEKAGKKEDRKKGAALQSRAGEKEG